ncbi:MAG: tripartite tricarboxylate transporter substrate binding protein [Alphaproteobacteria bacterium]|nr:tripartite tricarboxylate transporter substrate binding protein [Alphaproteobacteria bacterium]MBU0797003.1 tripartite tricarboxylate transporter substrate binding protein [Alphaproteobacteria bacterium]MBU0886590.1 tripartite tricarboxylate transporter substrate binding protein [Alphaproteobacteria bacterium]MBU1814179.1 tripartite tricarboxylate transporter substrate binding protein [Alphaproteobacteria bacterium]MBU2092099.1 tripartite tricarboxylate transporter substrate binding protein 
MSKNAFLSIAAAALMASAAFFPATADAAAPKCSTAQLIVPWGAGGDTDIVFRTFVDSINKSGVKPELQVVNIGGQGGNRGAAEARKAAPDGCTLLAIHESVITSFLTGRIDYTPDAFEPISLVTYTPSIIGAYAKAPFKSMEELIAAAKKEPKSITAGVTLGSTSHFIFLLIEDATGTEFRYVSYEGTRERNTALLAGNVLLGETNILTAKQYLSEGSLQALAIATDERDAALPEVPTLKEQKIPVTYGLARGVVAPKGTPAETIKFWEEVFAKAAKDPGLVKAITGASSSVMYKNAADYGAFLKASFAEHERLAIKIGMYKKP